MPCSLRKYFVIPFVIFISNFFLMYSSASVDTLKIYGGSSLDRVKELLSNRGEKFSVLEENFYERGNAKFVRISVKSINSRCGHVDMILSFFSDELSEVRVNNISKKSLNGEECIKRFFVKEFIYGVNVSIRIVAHAGGVYYDIIFRDIYLENKINKWLEEWS